MSGRASDSVGSGLTGWGHVFVSEKVAAVLCGMRDAAFQGNLPIFFHRSCCTLCHAAAQPSLCRAWGGERGRCPWGMLAGESQAASAELTHYWGLISQVCCFNFVFGSRFLKPSRGKKDGSISSQVTVMPGCSISVIQCLSYYFFNKMLEIKEAER